MRGHVGELLELAVAGFQIAGVVGELDLRGLAVGNVAHRGGGVVPVLGFQRREADLDREFGTVLAQAGQLQAGAHFAYFRVGEVAGAVAFVLAAQALGHQYLHGLADQFGALVAEQALGLLIHQRDTPVTVDDDHRVRCGFQQVLELRLGLLAVGDVTHRGGGEAAFLGFQRREADLDREFAAIGATAPEFQAGAHFTHFGVGEITGAVTDMLLAQALGHQHLHTLADHRVTGVAEQPFGLAVDQGDDAVLVDDHHRVRRGFQQVLDLLLGLLAVGDVAHRGGGEAPVLGLQRRQRNFDREAGAVLAAP